jgi:hypothetical protein
MTKKITPMANMMMSIIGAVPEIPFGSQPDSAAAIRPDQDRGCAKSRTLGVILPIEMREGSTVGRIKIP